MKKPKKEIKIMKLKKNFKNIEHIYNHPADL